MKRPVAVLVHGMGRTPLSMALLALRLRRAGFDVALYGYSPTVERLDACLQRLARFLARRVGDRPYIAVGHSLGTVLLRCVLPQMAHAPALFFLLAPPVQACAIARRAAPLLPYRLFTGEMGQRLADPHFMRSVPVPSCPAVVYAGTAGPRARWLPAGDEQNDGILKVSETVLAGAALVRVPALHTFLMNSRAVWPDLIGRARAALAAGPAAAP